MSILGKIEVFLIQNDMTASRFGTLATGDHNLVKDLRIGMKLGRERADRVMEFIAKYTPDAYHSTVRSRQSRKSRRAVIIGDNHPAGAAHKDVKPENPACVAIRPLNKKPNRYTEWDIRDGLTEYRNFCRMMRLGSENLLNAIMREHFQREKIG